MLVSVEIFLFLFVGCKCTLNLFIIYSDIIG